MNLTFYSALLDQVKTRIRAAQINATLAANAELITLYWELGRLIHQKQQTEGWGATVTKRLAADLHNELPDEKGFSERNLKFMVQFYREHPNLPIGKQPVSQLADDPQAAFLRIPWGHLILLMQKSKDLPTRLWYAQQTIENGWSRDVLGLMLKSQLHQRQGSGTHNFEQQLPAPQSDLARQALKDPYIFDFLTLRQPFTERELETELTRHIQQFLLELGTGFAFVGRQYQLTVSDKDYYLDLLFYHLQLRCYVVIDLKKGEFKPEYAGKMNFYCSAVDDLLRHPTDQPTIGLVLCQTKDRVLAEYALRDVGKPIGVSEFELTRALPDTIKSSLPSIEDIENELTQTDN
jgi:predicted nuclease of restriction endonuclease-like (RecB) superfamily